LDHAVDYTGCSNPKAADLSAHERGKEDRSLPLLTCPGHAAADPGTGPDAGQALAAGAGLTARYEQLRHAAVHARAQAFPLGLAVLTSGGLIGWTRVLAELSPTPTAPTPAPLDPPTPATPPTVVTRELIGILAALPLVPT
jgi:hypothetical protein